jgi:hypothetical protein
MKAVDNVHESTTWFKTPQMICDPNVDRVWRVSQEDGLVTTSYIGFVKMKGERTKTYSTLDKAPNWIQDRVAVLRMMPQDPNTSIVNGVGRRIDETTFWVVAPEEVGEYGEDPGESSQG